MNRNTLALSLGLVALLLLAATPAVNAAIINNNDPVGANYTIQAIDAGVSVDFTAHAPAAGNSNTIGKVTLTPNHASLVWLGFTLKQNAAAAETDSDNAGLRLLMDVVDQNGMIVPWIDYHVRAVDTSSPADPGSQISHLAAAHFHNTPAGFGSNPLVLAGIGNNVTQLDFGLGAQVAPGATFTATNILLHERDYEGLQREFRIETIPSVPEPSSIVLAAIGLIGLVVWRRRRR